MSIRITVIKDVRERGPQVRILDFSDPAAADNWFQRDSYYEQPYTRLAVWQRTEPGDEDALVARIAGRLRDSLIMLGIDPDERPEHGGKTTGEIMATAALRGLMGR